MPSEMQETIDLVNTTAGRLLEFLRGMGPEQWSAASACEGWTVADAVGHLSTSAGTWATSLARAMEGVSDPPPGQSFLEPGYRGDRGSSIIAQSAIAYREEAGAELLNKYESGYAGLKDQMAKLREEDWTKPCFHRRGPMPVGDYVALRVQELAVHSWDIRWGLETGAEMWQEPLPLLVGRVPRWLANAFRPGLDLPTPVRYRFQVDGPAPVNEDLLVTGDEFRTEKGAHGEPDVVFRTDTGNYILLIYGRLNVAGAIAEGRIQVDGNQDQAANFTVWFQGF